MKFYHLFFILLLMQVFFTLPFQRNIEVPAEPTSEKYAYSYLLRQGLGPMIFYPAGWATTEPVGVMTAYFGFYIGNAAMNLILSACVMLLYKLKR